MNPTLSWHLIASVQAVLETGSLSGAARALKVTQPTIRRHIDEIEVALGLPLFTRSPTGLVPTAAALAIAPHAEDIYASVAALIRTALAVRGDGGGTIRLSASEMMASEVLPSMLAAFMADRPLVEIELTASNRLDNLLRREADMAVRLVRPEQDGLVARKVTTIALGLFAATSYIDRCGVPESLDALIADHSIIGEDRQTAIADALTRIAPDAGKLRFRFRTDSDVVQLRAIRAGIGIGVCQVQIARSDPELHRVLPEITTTLDVWLVLHEDLRSDRRIRDLADHLGAALVRYAAEGG